MTPVFPKTDLARLVALPTPVRVLALVAALRFVGIEDLRFADVLRDEAEALVDEDLVFCFRLQRRLTDHAPTEVLALRRQGALSLAGALEVNPGSLPYATTKSCERSAMFLDHTMARSRFALLLARALHDEDLAPARLLSWEHDPERLADSVHLLCPPAQLVRQPLVADALAVVQGPRGIEGLLVEIDRGTERPGYMAKKYAGYLAWWHEDGPRRKFSVPAMRVLTVTPDRRRAERLQETCREATERKASGLFWFAAEDALVREGMLAPVWATPRTDHLALWS